MQFIITFIIIWTGFQYCEAQKRKEDAMNYWQMEQNRQHYRRQVDRTACRQTHPSFRNGCKM